MKSAAAIASAGISTTEQVEFDLLLEAIFRCYGYDFRGYAPGTLVRRFSHARRHFDCATYSQLQDRILREPALLPALIDQVTIPVSDMFRDPEFFRALREKVVPYLRTFPLLRIWVAGCSTGEELYSLAILFREENLEDRTQFYATDIRRSALEQAEAGVYPLERIATFTRNHQLSGAGTSLSDYYTAGARAVKFDRSLRQQTVFADHSLVTDAVFAETHLVVCRNVLIYFQRELQDRAVGLFSDSLVHGGFLGLGTRESLRVNARSGDFADFDPAVKLYRKRGAA
jgi:chemotaxis protein methyltransferase CheR